MKQPEPEPQPEPQLVKVTGPKKSDFKLTKHKPAPPTERKPAVEPEPPPPRVGPAMRRARAPMSPRVKDLQMPLLASPLRTGAKTVLFAPVRPAQLTPNARAMLSGGGAWRAAVTAAANPLESSAPPPTGETVGPSPPTEDLYIPDADEDAVGLGVSDMEAVTADAEAVAAARLRASPRLWSFTDPRAPSTAAGRGQGLGGGGSATWSSRSSGARHAAFDAMETKQNYRRLVRAGALADTHDPWPEMSSSDRLGEAPPLTAVPSIFAQLDGFDQRAQGGLQSDSASSIASSHAIGSQASLAMSQTSRASTGLRSHTSRASTRGTEAAAATAAAAAAVVLRSQRLGTSGSVLPLNSKGELRQQLAPLAPLSMGRPAPRTPRLMTPSTDRGRSDGGGCGGGMVARPWATQRRCVPGPSRGVPVTGLY